MSNFDSLRPVSLTDFGGQEELSHDLNILLRASLEREELPEHILFAGPPGLGKTTLAAIVANELKLPLVTTSGPAIERPGDIASLLTGLRTPSVVFIDEIHALDKKAEELLYSAMEDMVLDVVIGEGVKTRSVRVTLEPFTLIGATTQAGLLSSPLRDRFGFHGRLKLYDELSLSNIIVRSSLLLGVDLSPQASLELAMRSRGTPRIANRLLRRVRDWVQVKYDLGNQKIISINIEQTLEALEAYGVDPKGLDSLGRDILLTLINSFNGGPVGIGALAAAVGEATTTIEQVYEPYLMRQGLLQRTLRGRQATPQAWLHLGLIPPDVTQSSDSPIEINSPTLL